MKWKYNHMKMKLIWSGNETEMIWNEMKSMLETPVSPTHECLWLFMVFVLTVLYLHFVHGLSWMWKELINNTKKENPYKHEEQSFTNYEKWCKYKTHEQWQTTHVTMKKKHGKMWKIHPNWKTRPEVRS